MKTQQDKASDPPGQQRVAPHWRWPTLLAGLFVGCQVGETILGTTLLARLAFDVASWGALGGLVFWVSRAWARQQAQRQQAALATALQTQARLTHQLQHVKRHLALLCAMNQHLATASTLDELADALTYPQRLAAAHTAALLLLDAFGHSEADELRTCGAPPGTLAALRATFGIGPELVATPGARLLAAPPAATGGGPPPAPGPTSACLLLPLHDGLAPIGWIELYLPPGAPPAAETVTLLETIAHTLADAIIGARRRAREERASDELERAIAEERARIARDMHDGLAQNLALLRMRVDLWQDWVESDPQHLRDELVQLKQTLSSQIGELRRAIFALRPVPFDELGFAGGLRHYINDFAGQQGWETHLDLQDAPPALTLELEATCFRIVQEALTNAAKHAAATHVAVAIDQTDGGLRIIVRDNGRGFEPDHVAAAPLPDHIGLRQMSERLAAVRGQLTLHSQPGTGTELRIWIPLNR